MGNIYGKGDRGKATQIHAEIVRARGECRSCHRRPPSVRVECAHIIPRRHARTRTDLDNAFCLCSACHRRYTENPDEWMHFIDQTIGRAEFERLKAKALDGSGQRFDWSAELARLKEIRADWLTAAEVTS